MKIDDDTLIKMNYINKYIGYAHPEFIYLKIPKKVFVSYKTIEFNKYHGFGDIFIEDIESKLDSMTVSEWIEKKYKTVITIDDGVHTVKGYDQ